MSAPQHMVNSGHAGMVIRTVTSRAPRSLDVREHERVTQTPVTRGRTL